MMPGLNRLCFYAMSFVLLSGLISLSSLFEQVQIVHLQIFICGQVSRSHFRGIKMAEYVYILVYERGHNVATVGKTLHYGRFKAI